MKGYKQFRCLKCGRIFLVSETDHTKEMRLCCPYDKCGKLKYIDPYDGIKGCMTNSKSIQIDD